MPRFGPEPQKFFASVYESEAPWDIGEPQPALVQLFAEFPLIDPVLDVGCGSGDLSIWIAQQGTKVVGVDFVPAAIELAKKRAASVTPALAANVEFRVGDALHPASLGQFGSVVDSGFYHLFEAEQCEPFAHDLVNAVRRGGRYYLLAFAVEFPVPDVPRAVSEAEIRKYFIETGHWTGHVLRPAEFVSRVGNVPAICACLERT